MGPGYSRRSVMSCSSRRRMDPNYLGDLLERIGHGQGDAHFDARASPQPLRFYGLLLTRDPKSWAMAAPANDAMPTTSTIATR